MTVTVSRLCPTPLPLNRLQAIAECYAAQLKLKRWEVSCLFVDDKTMRRLNKQYKKHDYATDVLSFPQVTSRQIKSSKQKTPGLLGDIVISVDTARKNAKLFKNTIKRELALYVAHGLLHLNGLRDDTDRAKKIMRKEEEKLLAAVCKKELL